MHILFRFFFFRERFFGRRSLLKKGGSGEGTIRPLTVTPWVFFPEGFSGTKFLKKAPEKASLKRVHKVLYTKCV